MDLLVQVGGPGQCRDRGGLSAGEQLARALRRTGSEEPSKIYINLAKNLPPGGLARTIAHEVLHHMTMMKLMRPGAAQRHRGASQGRATPYFRAHPGTA